MKEYITTAILFAKFLLICFSYVACMAGIMLLIVELDKALR